MPHDSFVSPRNRSRGIMGARTLFPLLALVLAACGSGDSGGDSGAAAESIPENERYGGTAVVAISLEPQALNVLTGDMGGEPGMMKRDLLFSPLIRYDKNLEPVPWLAERWDTLRVAPDTLELTFHLRRDVQWHDGVPVTAEDVKFTFERLMDPRTAYAGAYIFAMYAPKAALVDRYTVKFRLRSHSDFLEGWYWNPPVPKHLLGDVAPEQIRTHTFGTHPVGNGPFRFVRRVPGQEWVFEANPNFPKALGGRPYLERVIFRVIPMKTTLVTELLTGAIDVWLGVKPSEADRLARTPGVRLIAYSYSKWDYLAWNARLPMFDTPEERRALTLAIDRQALVDAVLHGHGTVGRSTVTPAHWSFTANDPATLLPYDTAEARRLLAGAGWRDRNGDGVLEDEQGRPFRFTLKTIQGDDAWKEVVEIVQAQLKRIGVDAQPQLLEFNALIALGEGSPNRDGVRIRDFEAVALHFYDDFRKDDSQILHSRNADRSVYQWTGFSHPRADWLMDTLKVIADRETARPLWREYQRLIVQESPFTLLFYPERLIAVRTRLKGVEADARGDLLTVTRWWVPPGERRAAERRNP